MSINQILSPSLCNYIKVVEQNLLPNYPVKRDDILVAEDIFEKHCLMKVDTIRKHGDHVVMNTTSIPLSFMEQ